MADDKKTLDFSALGQAIDTTWGRSSTPTGASQSLKFAIRGDKQLEVRYVAIVNMVTIREMDSLKKKYVDEANSIIDSALKKIKTDYKEQAESTIKFKQVGEDDRFEIINLNIYNGKKTAYFRRHIVYEMS